MSLGAHRNTNDESGLKMLRYVRSQSRFGYDARGLSIDKGVKKRSGAASTLEATVAAAAAATLLLSLLYLRQRRRVLQARLGMQAALETANRALEGKVAARTAELTRTVETLEAEVSERMQAERTLRAAQEELVQAGKLAVLGQLATGITHELNQPLGAIRKTKPKASAAWGIASSGASDRRMRDSQGV